MVCCAALEMVDGLAAAGLPPAHVGLHAGPVLFQEGDYFGQTVNLSARIADYARPGEVLVSQAVADASKETGHRVQGHRPGRAQGRVGADAPAPRSPRLMTGYPVIFLPGSVVPAEPAYAALLQVLGERVNAVAKDLEVYAGDQPPPDLQPRTQRSRGSCARPTLTASTASISSATRAAAPRRSRSQPPHGERLLSLALLEPAWAGNERTPGEEALWQRFRALAPLPPDEFMAGFVRLQLAPGVEPPPPPEGPPPPWMAKRPAGLRAFIDAFDNGDLDLEALRAFDRPVYFALGGRSNPDYYGRMAERLAAIFPDFTIETFPERHHFDPPHRIEPERLANSLLALWQRADASRTGPPYVNGSQGLG